VACELARCAAKVGAGRGKLTPAEEAERTRYLDDAMAVLRQAASLGLRDAQAVKRDGDLAPLRSRADFQNLVKELEEKEQKGP
jgi:hypothetical protein